MSIDLSTLKLLPFDKQLTFAYLTCERLYPNYVYFSDNFDFGAPQTLKSAIEYLYNQVLFNSHFKPHTLALIDKIEVLTPNPADFDTVLASSALDACGVVFESLNFVLDHNFLRLKDISMMAIDSVDMYIQDVERLDMSTDALFQKKIDDHPLMLKEVSIQSGIIDFLTTVNQIHSNDLQLLLEVQMKHNKGNLNL